jgi:tRNA dimethylallyltransferase
LKPFSVSGFKQDLTSTISKLEQTCPKIFLVGGSGLFIDAFIYNYNLDPESKVSQLARRELAKLPVIELQKILDESSFKKLSESDQKNPYRLMRHIERSGQKYSKGKTIKHLYTVIDVPIQELEERIKLRTEKMFVNGLVEENDQIRELEKNNDQLTIIHKTIGYKEFDPFYLGEKSIEEVKAEINLRTRQYAKRQITWFKKKL